MSVLKVLTSLLCLVPPKMQPAGIRERESNGGYDGGREGREGVVGGAVF